MKPTCLYYVHDPMCSWCWGFRPVFKELKQLLPESLSIEYVLGGLAPDNDEVMPIPMQESICNTWRTIERKLGTSFNFEFWEKCKPRRSTYPTCRAVIAADNQGQGESMLFAIQEAYYLRAMNPSDDATLIALAEEIKLDRNQFEKDINSTETEEELERQIDLGESLGVMGMPGLVLRKGESNLMIAIDYLGPETMAEQIREFL